MNAGSIGIPELTILLFASILWVVPVAAALWALRTLHRIRVTQEAMRVKLEAIERGLQRTA